MSKSCYNVRKRTKDNPIRRRITRSVQRFFHRKVESLRLVEEEME